MLITINTILQHMNFNLCESMILLEWKFSFNWHPRKRYCGWHACRIQLVRIQIEVSIRKNIFYAVPLLRITATKVKLLICYPKSNFSHDGFLVRALPYSVSHGRAQIQFSGNLSSHIATLL